MMLFGRRIFFSSFKWFLLKKQLSFYKCSKFVVLWNTPWNFHNIFSKKYFPCELTLSKKLGIVDKWGHRVLISSYKTYFAPAKKNVSIYLLNSSIPIWCQFQNKFRYLMYQKCCFYAREGAFALFIQYHWQLTLSIVNNSNLPTIHP